MRMLNVKDKDDREFLEFIMNSELNLNLDKSIFKSKKSVLEFFNDFANVFKEFGIVVDENVVIFAD